MHGEGSGGKREGRLVGLLSGNLGLGRGLRALGRAGACKPDGSPSCTHLFLSPLSSQDFGERLLKGFSLLLGGQRGIKGN